MDLLELLKTIGAAAGNIVTISGCLALCIRPIREKLARFIRRASRTDASEKRIADMFAMLEQHIESGSGKNREQRAAQKRLPPSCYMTASIKSTAIISALRASLSPSGKGL